MCNIVTLVVLVFLMGCPSLAINERCSSFIGNLVDINSASNQEDSDKLKALRDNSSSKDLSNYAFCSNGKWLLLSKNANNLTKQLIGKNKLRTGTCVMVKGYIRGNVIIVKKISDISIQQF
jgi:hypothetical protein